jgi:hypothetical protein
VRTLNANCHVYGVSVSKGPFVFRELPDVLEGIRKQMSKVKAALDDLLKDIDVVFPVQVHEVREVDVKAMKDDVTAAEGRDDALMDFFNQKVGRGHSRCYYQSPCTKEMLKVFLTFFFTLKYS